MGKRAGGLTFCVVLLTVAALAGPASSQAAQTIGQTGVPLSPPCFGATYRQATLTSGAAYSTPTRGVVTAWSTFAGSAPTQTLQFVTIHPDPATPGSFIYDGVDIERNISPGTLNTFSSGVRLPIVAGGEIGIHLPLNSQASCIFTTVAGDNYGLGAGTPTPGSSQAFSSGTFDMARVDVSAKVEPDVDGDGFGDETQDLCPTNPASQSACAKKCKKKHHKHSSASAAKKHKHKGCKKKKRKK